MHDLFEPDSDHGRVYRALVSAPRSTASALERLTDLSPDLVAAALAKLRRLDAVVCVEPETDRWDAKRPDIVAAGILKRFNGWRAQLHEAESRLTEAYRFARFDTSGGIEVEILKGREATFARFRELQEGASSHVYAIDRPPYYWDDAELARQERVQLEQMAAGIVYRTICKESGSDSPVRNVAMARTVAAGENARVLARPPVKLTIIDSEVAVIALDPPHEAPGTLVALVLHNEEMVTVLCDIFESLWSLAVPVNLDSLGQGISAREREILTLMASGAGDDAIARRLGVSRRTIVRHIGRLLEHLGATTRFQAGAQAARRGWL